MRALPSAALRTCCAVAALLLLLLAGAEGKKQVPEQVEKSLLSMFGLRSRPRPDRSKVVIPPAMLEMWRLQFEAQQQLTQARKTAPHDLRLPGRKTHGANTVRSFTHAESETDSKHSEPHRFRLHFDVSSIPEGELLQAAELQLSHDSAAAQRHSGSKVRVLVHDIVRRGGRGREPITRLVDSRLVSTAANGSVALDVLPAVRRWLQGHQHNHGLLVEVLAHDRYPEASPVVRPAPHHHVRLRRSAGESDDQWLPRQPVLLAFTDDRRRPQRRTKRGGPSSKSKSKAKQGRPMCQRHKLYVDFHDVGWNDWIVAPQGYEAYYCHGDCPFPLQAHLNATNHAIVQTLMNSMNPSRVPQACCVPTDLTSISMLYLDEESKVVLKNYMDMAVVGCGCR